MRSSILGLLRKRPYDLEVSRTPGGADYLKDPQCGRKPNPRSLLAFIISGPTSKQMTNFLLAPFAKGITLKSLTPAAMFRFQASMAAAPVPSVPGVSRPLRVWFTGEAKDPRRQLFDLHFGFSPTSILGQRWHRYPLWILYIDWWNPDLPSYVHRLLQPRAFVEKERFCNFIYSNEMSIRAEFFHRLNAVRHVDSVGGILNNHDGWRPAGGDEKRAFLARSLFTIAFENQISPGYVTEKLLEPLMAGSIAIYWGAIEAKKDFNPASFVCAADQATLHDLVQHIIRLSGSRDALEELSSASPFLGNKIPYEHTPEFFVDRVSDALSGGFAKQIPADWRLI